MFVIAFRNFIGICIGFLASVLAYYLLPNYFGSWGDVPSVVVGAVVVGVLAKSRYWLCGIAAAVAFEVFLLYLVRLIAGPITTPEMADAWKSDLRMAFFPFVLSIVIGGTVAELVGRAVAARRE